MSKPELSEAAKTEAKEAIGRHLDRIRKVVISFLDAEGQEIIWITRDCRSGETITVMAPNKDNIEVI